MNATTNLSKPKSKGKEITTRPSTTLSIEHTAINNDVPTAAQQIVRSIKSIPGRVDCNFFNYYYYCSQCGLKLPKNILRCISCKQKVRTESVYLFLMSSKKTKCVEELNIITGINSINMPVIQVTISQGRSVEQKRELVKVLTRETARIMKTDEEKVRILIYEVSKENWGNAGILGLDMK